MTPTPPDEISERLISTIADRIQGNLQVRRTLPDGGRVHIDRQLPFLVVYRPPAGPDEGTARFVRGEASYLIAPGRRQDRAGVSHLVTVIADRLVDAFGAFLIIELWAGPDADARPSASGTAMRPGFRVIAPRHAADRPSVTRLVRELGRVRILKRSADVELVTGGRQSPPGLPRLSAAFAKADSPVQVIGVEIRPIYRDGDTQQVYPLMLQRLQREVARAIRRSAFEFSMAQTSHRPRHYQALGRRALVRAATQVDHELAELAQSFDLLLAVSPTNTEAAFRSFRRSRYQKQPTFLYRPRQIDPALLKRRLYAIPVERVEDPTLEMIFREKQRELSLKLDLLADRETRRFLPDSVALYGDVDAAYLATARDLLERLPTGKRGSNGGSVDAATLVARAEAEILRYRSANPDVAATVQVRDDLTSLMVSNGHLLVGRDMTFAPGRVGPLIQHEVGTHVLTHWNGMAQPLRLLATGLAGHDELQEGLGVFAEYLADGLTAQRLRTIAGRVVAARAVADGAEFTETFRVLRSDHDFTIRSAFLTAVRAHRGGGFVKDAVYLRGLQQVVAYVADGGRLETLLVGKIATEHAPVVEELQRRHVLVTPPLRPEYLDDPDTHYRLERVRAGVDLVDLTT